MTVYQKIISLLDQHNIEYKTFEHPPVTTSEDAARVRGTDLTKGAKALVLLGDKTPVLCVLSGNRRVDFKKVKQALGVKDLRMATHEEVKTLTNCEVGGVPPIGPTVGLPTYLDESFTANETMDFNAGERERSIEMLVKDFVQVVEPQICDISL